MSVRRFIALASPLSLFCFLFTAGAGLGLDQYTKVMAFEHLCKGVVWHDGVVRAIPTEPMRLIPGWLEFEVMANQGAVFGVGQGQRVLFISVSVAAIFFIFYLFSVSGRQRFYQIILGMLMAGVVGNLYDRARFQYVRDMIHMRLPNHDPFPYIFNVADSFLCVGVALMILHSLLQQPAKKT